MSKYIPDVDLSRMLGLERDEIFEMARLRGLPFAICTQSPRRLMIRDADFNRWRRAVLDRES
jgi:hypothetical protein